MHTRQWDAGGDSFDSLCGIGILEVADLLDLSHLMSLNCKLCLFGLGDLQLDVVDENETNEEIGT